MGGTPLAVSLDPEVHMRNGAVVIWQDIRHRYVCSQSGTPFPAE
jgi:hypothetical protein